MGNNPKLLEMIIRVGPQAVDAVAQTVNAEKAKKQLEMEQNYGAS